MRRAVFMDRDGVIVKAVFREEFKLPTSPRSLKEFHIFKEAKIALDLLKKEGFLCVLVSNQPDMAYGNVSEEEWKKMQSKVEDLCFDDIFICFHKKEDGCFCKKPSPAMLLQAKDKWNIDLKQSFMVGDTSNDILAAQAAGCRSVVINAFYNIDLESDFRASNIAEAAELILSLT